MSMEDFLKRAKELNVDGVAGVLFPHH
jgi:hypothetical protein